jgi:hypothetical protein
MGFWQDFVMAACDRTGKSSGTMIFGSNAARQPRRSRHAWRYGTPGD